MLLGKVFSKPEKASIYWNLIFQEMYSLGIGSLGIISIISFFMILVCNALVRTYLKAGIRLVEPLSKI